MEAVYSLWNIYLQVYYTSDLPVDAQVVLQQAQQIIDASLMQQSSPQRPQHVCLLTKSLCITYKYYNQQ